MEVSAHSGLRVLAHFGQKNQTIKLIKLIDIFEINQVLVYKFLCQIFPKLLYCILLTRTKSMFNTSQ